MKIERINDTATFDKLTEDWRNLQVWQFGPLETLDDEDENEYTNTNVIVGTVDEEPVAYLISEDCDLWHIETKDGHGGNGYGKTLCESVGIKFAWEVCSDAGAALCESLNIDFEDCRF